MNKLAFALGLTLLAAPVMAEGLAFEPVDPEGLDETAAEMVAQLQDGMPGQLPMFEQAGYGAYGALAVPVGVELTPQSLASAANLANAEEATEKTLEVCKAQTGYDCTVIGLLVPATE